ncbi:hypothetical protein GMST_23200 [Geomonas silvestris]|uniref:histidine kinase n=1 Tax=Geomonas silvestris TaxID=2740184 RepID=A0A6V8MIZ9_9BACT|nr:response regulator [Geomonas silvestris]GFO59995.1 hypothetical protein GMST_23200 [Geomonas silvestris]
MKPAQSQHAGAPADLTGLSLLYVEDEAEPRVMVSKMLVLNYPNLTVYSAENGAAGLAAFQEHLPDIVVTDINMPVMDGIQMSRAIKEIRPDALIIAVTAHSDTSYLLNAIQIGIHYYVLKPINYDELFSALDKVLGQLALKQLVELQNRRISESERQLALAQRIAHLGSWQCELPGGSMTWSEEMYRLLDHIQGSQAATLDRFLERVHPEDRDLLQERLAASAATRQPVVPLYCRIRRADASERILKVEATVMSTRKGAPVTLVGTALDVTELKRAEEEVRSLTGALERRVLQRTSLLQASLRELEHFSYLVSHDLRAPVARLEGFCRALVEDCGECRNDNCRTYAERAERVVRQIKSIIGAFNELSHYTRCGMVIGEVDLSALARSIGSDFQRTEPERSVRFHIADGLVVQGDQRLLRIALEHLIGNAWKFTAKKDRASIEFAAQAQEGTRVYFVRDNGAGFDMRYVDKLFKPFQTIHSPGDFTWSGTAIGLATVHSIVLRHGGTIWAEGEVDRGATFFFTLADEPEPGSYYERTH